MGQANNRGTLEERIRLAKSTYKKEFYKNSNQLGDYIFTANEIPAALLDFCRHPRPWQDVLQRPYTFDEVLRRHTAGEYGKVRLPEVFVRKSGTVMFGVGPKYWTHSHLSGFRACASHILYEEIGADFFETQSQRNLKDRHPLAVWHTVFEEWRKPQSTNDPKPELGASIAWTMLAYQIYLLKENSELPSSLLDRLRNDQNFQGARYEVYVAAMMLVCGYKIEWLPHSNEPYVEFIATHKNGRKFAVEAKSKHRPGVLITGAIDAPDAPFRIDFQSNIVAGIRKNPELPLLLFVEANVPHGFEEIPSAMMHEIDRAWTKFVNRKEWEPQGFPCVGLIVTNDPLFWNVPSDVDINLKSAWAWNKSGPHRHGFDATSYLQEICSDGSKANIVPNIMWDNTNPPPSLGHSNDRIAELHE
jgi:hypothetical protein